jgi:hypothetical protein
MGLHDMLDGALAEGDVKPGRSRDAIAATRTTAVTDECAGPSANNMPMALSRPSTAAVAVSPFDMSSMRKIVPP